MNDLKPPKTIWEYEVRLKRGRFTWTLKMEELYGLMFERFFQEAKSATEARDKAIRETPGAGIITKP